MIFWKSSEAKHRVCKECGVHFEPVSGYEARWGDLCSIHRKPVMERDLRRDMAMVWAAQNWEMIASMAEEDEELKRKVLAERFAASATSLCGKAAAQNQGIGFVENPLWKR